MDLGDRMKTYEKVSSGKLTRRVPVIIRVDGRAFHSLTKKMGAKKPFDPTLMSWMDEVALSLFKEIQGAKCAYVQSDEISILVTDYDTVHTEPWFGYKLNKVVSISASIATATMARYLTDHQGHFDSRAFNVPENDVDNYFLWRQRDWQRNSVQMLARSLFSHKELQGKNTTQLKEMCLSKGKDWGELHSHYRNGRLIVDNHVLAETPDRINALAYVPNI